MNWSKYGLLAGLLVVMLTVSVFGVEFGYTVRGIPNTTPQPGSSGNWQEAEYGLDVAMEYYKSQCGVIDVGMEVVEFMYYMSTFQIDGMPFFFNMIFIVMGVLSIFLVVSLIRGTS